MFPWKTLLLLSSLFELSQQRTNLAQRHPCYPINKRLEPFIHWTEHLISSQYGAAKDACEQVPRHNPVCCTNEILDSHTMSLANELKNIFDAELNLLQKSFSQSNQLLELWIKEYIPESRQSTISSLETIFGVKEYLYHVHPILTTLFNTLGNHQATDIQVANAVNGLFNQLIISMYRHFMSKNQDLTFNHTFEKCLMNQALNHHSIFPTQRELLYTLTSASSLVQIFRRLTLYIEADIQRLKETITFHSSRCLQRYSQEMLCPICADSSLSTDQHQRHPEGLCENNCQLLLGNCFNQTDNPFTTFAMSVQGYARVINQMRESIHELKLVERLSKFHIYLYDMVINATNTRLIYTTIQKLCPHAEEKPFHPLQSVVPITMERRDFVSKWNDSLHAMLHERQSSIRNLNLNFTQQIVRDLCSQSTSADRSSHCRQIDPFSPTDFSASSPITIDLTSESIRNQIDDLEKKLEPIENMIVSLRPKKKYSIHDDLPDFDYETENQTSENAIENGIFPADEQEDENVEGYSFSDQLDQWFDGQVINLTITTTVDGSRNRNKPVVPLDFNDDRYSKGEIVEVFASTMTTTTVASIITTTAATTTVEEKIDYSSALTYHIPLNLLVFLLLLLRLLLTN